MDKNSQIRTPEVYKHEQYDMLKRLIKSGTFAGVRVTANLLGVRPETIQSWLKSPAILKLVNSEVNSYITGIRDSRDWKAKAYLIDKLFQVDQSGHEIATQIIIVNNDKEFSINTGGF